MASNDDQERWNERFAEPGYRFGTDPNKFLASQRDRLKKGQSALAVADGEGRNGVWLAEQGLDVLSVDFSPAAQAKARALAAERHVALKTMLADVKAWDWEPERFDVVVGILIQFTKPSERTVMFRGFKTTLKPGGLVILQGYRVEQLQYKTGGPPFAENLYTEALLRREFADMRILHLSAHDDPVEARRGGSGLAALIDLVAEKP
jgi:cyclopropane fatty-acyl-phospholipid synthase-like methyltransferase